MAKVETYGVVGGGGDGGELNSFVRGMARRSISTPYLGAKCATFEGRA